MAANSISSLSRFAVLAFCALFLAACAGSASKSDQAEATEATEPETTAAEGTKSALMSVGADIGCGIATLIKKDCAKGAAIGSKVVDKAVSWVFRSLKIADGKTVNKEYEARNIAVSKTEVKPMAFETRIQSADEVKPAEQGKAQTQGQTQAQAQAQTQGQAQAQSTEIKVTSNTDLVGYGDKVPVVTQKYALYDENNKLVSTQTEKVAAVDGAGRYETEAKVKIPKSKKIKQYRVESTLIVDGKEYKKNSYNVVMLDGGELTLAIADFTPLL